MNVLIVLNWNTTDLLINMFESACKNSSLQFKTIIVDNGSIDSEFEKLKNYFKNKLNLYNEKNLFENYKDNIYGFKNKDFNVELKRLPKNIGFAAGNNVALDLLECDYELVFFVNSDIIIDEVKWDNKFNDVFLNKEVGVSGCAYHPLKWSSEGRFLIQKISETAIESESVQGAFFSIPFKLLKELKNKDNFIFDEKFKFAHYEETDLCFRIMNIGYKCIWFPLKHQHLHEKSSTKKNGYKLSEEIKNVDDFKSNSERNRLYLFEKHKEFFNRKK